MFLSVISLWKFSKVIEKGRLVIACAPRVWLSRALELPKLRKVQLTPKVAYESTVLPQAFHDDPADQFIVHPYWINRHPFLQKMSGCIPIHMLPAYGYIWYC